MNIYQNPRHNNTDTKLIIIVIVLVLYFVVKILIG